MGIQLAFQWNAIWLYLKNQILGYFVYIGHYEKPLVGLLGYISTPPPPFLFWFWISIKFRFQQYITWLFEKCPKNVKLRGFFVHRQLWKTPSGALRIHFWPPFLLWFWISIKFRFQRYITWLYLEKIQISEILGPQYPPLWKGPGWGPYPWEQPDKMCFLFESRPKCKNWTGEREKWGPTPPPPPLPIDLQTLCTSETFELTTFRLRCSEEEQLICDAESFSFFKFFFRFKNIVFTE